ncbi:WXG100 family type VII secretion target [Rhizomonospora bruguierae]|uniref:WXG100 family type VII secretion target n=1 Tax=Rhizomonospora bruguierae TaxID=1581705 RepID=UPI001BCB292D|nr:WXG100 family type VII secretion target [Micromonospora sp. NBRC 107566]
MPETRAQAAVMAQTAAKFEQVDDSLQAMLRRLLAQLEGLRTAWQGTGGRSFEQVKVAWSEDQTALHRALRETASAIRTAGHQYDATDTEAASRVGATGRRGGLTLPL